MRSAPERPAGLGPGGPATLELVETSDAWAHVPCRGEDAGLFFGPNRFEPKRERIAREQAAKAICARCPALRACREHALAYGELYGVWGGLGEADRRAILEGGGQVATAV